jgi:hypothetical protein
MKKQARPAVQLTAAPFCSERDGRWYMIVRHGGMVEHVRLTEPEQAASLLVRLFGVTPAQAKRMLREAEAA